MAGPARPAWAQFPITNEVNGTFDASSYDTQPYKFFGDYFADYFYNLYPQFTNHIYSVSRSGASMQNQFESQQEKYCLPLWASFAVAGNDWMLQTENGGYTTTNPVIQWGTNLFAAPPLFWNGTAVSNEGVTMPVITHYPLGAIPDQYDGIPGNAQLNLGGLMLAARYSVPPVDLYHRLYVPAWSNDFSGAKLTGFDHGSGQDGHPYAAGHLCITLEALLALGAETNIGALTLDWNNHLVAATNKVTVISPSLSGNTLSCSVHFDRMPPAWDVPDGTITNDARNAFVIMPELGNAFNWIIQVTNLPAGTYKIYVDNVLTDIASDTQLAAGRNWFTNYNGPLWAARVAPLAAKRDQNGVNRVTLLEHSAGDADGDNVNYQSNAATQYDDNGLRGGPYKIAMATHVANLKVKDVAIHDAAQQTTHTLMFVLQTTTYVLFHR